MLLKEIKLLASGMGMSLVLLMGAGCYSQAQNSEKVVYPDEIADQTAAQEKVLYAYEFDNVSAPLLPTAVFSRLKAKGFDETQLKQLENVYGPTSWTVNQEHMFTPEVLPLSLSMEDGEFDDLLHWRSNKPVVIYPTDFINANRKYQVAITAKGEGEILLFFYGYGKKVETIGGFKKVQVQGDKLDYFVWTVDLRARNDENVRIALALSGNLFLKDIEITEVEE